MATSGQLIEGMANILRYPKQEVLKHDRFLAEQRLRTVGGRGRSAARMTSLDAASLLGSIMAAPANNDPLHKSADSWRSYRDLPCMARLQKVEGSEADTRWQSGIRQLDALPEGHTAVAAIAAAIECAAEPHHWMRGPNSPAWRATHPDNIVIDFHSPVCTVDIRVWNAELGRDEFHRYMDRGAFAGGDRLPGIRQVRTVDFEVLLQLGQLLKR